MFPRPSAFAALFFLAAFLAACSGSTKSGGGGDPGPGFGGKPVRPGEGGSGGGEGGSGGHGGTGGEGGSGGEGGGAPGIQVDSVRPARGTVDGGDQVIVSGLGFVSSIPRDVDPDEVVRVTFGGNVAIGLRVIDDDTILVPTPPGQAGDADVVVSNGVDEVTCAGCFRYLAPVELRSIEPREGPVAGGTAITLRGDGLREGMIVLVGDRAALDVRLGEDGSLAAIAPPGDGEGPVSVRVFDADGQDLLRLAYTYRDPLALEAIEPPGGPLAGGNRVVLRGTGLDGAEVRFDGVPAQVQVGVDGTFSAIVPPGAAPGPVEVTVETAAEAIVAAGAYAYFDPAETRPNLYVVSPSRGPVDGGNPVTLVGTGLDAGALAVRFGGTLADAEALGPNFVRATAPAAPAPGAVSVSLRVATGGSTLEGAYRYTTPILLDSVSPAAGPTDGGTAITVRGANFPEGARVFVGALEAGGVTRVDGETLTATTPRGTDGPVPVRVVDPADPSSVGVLADAFRYEGGFSAGLLTPTVGARAGGTRVTFLGTGFGPGLAIRFGASDASSVTVENAFLATAVTPRAAGNGTVDVTVAQDGASVTIPASFTYFDPTSSRGGSSGGPINGTLNVTALDGGNARHGVPLPGCTVTLGNGEQPDLVGTTDERGQVTFADARLVKAQVVSVSLPDYQTVTVVNQESENLTVFMVPNFEPPECDNGLDDDGDGLIDLDGDGDPSRADLDGCDCGPWNLPEDKQQYASLCSCPMFVRTESNYCCNGIDDDGDGKIDADDPECGCTGGSSEGPLPACSNCKDDDGDGGIDYINPSGYSDGGCASFNDDDERGALVEGRVFGFKRPPTRRLGPNEVEVAYVWTSFRSVYHAPPWGYSGRGIEIRQDGGAFAFEFRSDMYFALYATYGILDQTTGAFEPLLMGIRRNVNATVQRPLTAQDITLDMHLDLEVPVAIDNFPTYGGAPGVVTVYAYVDLGKEGVVPVGEVTTQTASALLTRLPRLSGESFVFQLWGNLGGDWTFPLSVTFRRQAGDISKRPDGSGGIVIGPVMGLTRITEPFERFEGLIEWTAESGPPAELAMLQIDEPTLSGPIPQWQLVVPGQERRVVVPQAVLAALRAKYEPGTVLQLTLITGREPRFSYDQWSYDDLNLNSFTSFTYDVVELQL